jgi:chitinase
MFHRSAIAVAVVVSLAAAAPAWAADTQPPTAPTNLRASDVTMSTVTLSWTRSTDNVGVTVYQIFDGGTFIDSTTSTQYMAWALRPGTTHSYHVIARDAADNTSRASNTVRVTTLADTEAPSTPTISVARQTQTSVALTWNTSVDNNGGSGDIDYLVNDGTTTHIVHTTTSLSLSGLATNKVYTFTIRARDSSGNASGSSQVSAFLETTPPAAPTNLRETRTSDGRQALAWDAARDNSGQIDSYQVLVNGSAVSRATGTTFGLQPLIDSFVLIPGQTYSFSIRAVDPSGNVGPASAPLQVRVQ